MTENYPLEGLRPGQRAETMRRLTVNDIELFALMGGEIDSEQIRPAGEGHVAAHASGCVALVLWLICNRMPGAGSEVMRHDLRSAGMVMVGDEIDCDAELSEVDAETGLALFRVGCRNQHGSTLLYGHVWVRAPRERIVSEHESLPEITLHRHDGFAHLLESCKTREAVSCAIVHPCDRDSLLGALEAARHGLIRPILVGPQAKIRATAEAAGASLDGIEMLHTEHSHAAAMAAVELARNGLVESLMKGSLHTDELMAAVVPSATGLRTGRRISHVFVLDVPAYSRPLLVTDAAINIAPAFEEKIDIVQNAIDLAHILGIPEPKVAILSATEVVNSKIPSTMDAALLCKMADRGQITGGILDGPLAFDNAISIEAARTKRIVSPVAGQADILVAPDLEAGNMLAKNMAYFAGADIAGVVVGARVPIVLTSRADSVRSRLASAAIMALVAHARRPTVEE
ncbi:bifunctional enoyl-CoA hydratase/phosphate acetyltransferase [Chitinivorax sp. B]|uniref:bifunctional enoyl-CoA hydratase/phosphate acetyltransferase n=1 Tax=Chitinivorax sp. B TaxID=2502235 RepID=UPI0010F6F9AD|nr:bifunctional enoyl-CoA hydratase/phosphate acetyltransferase [Chitinivorax sp. B]